MIDLKVHCKTAEFEVVLIMAELKTNNQPNKND